MVLHLLDFGSRYSSTENKSKKTNTVKTTVDLLIKKKEQKIIL